MAVWLRQRRCGRGGERRLRLGGWVSSVLHGEEKRKKEMNLSNPRMWSFSLL